jgi:prolyl oligopeptidase
MNSDPYQWLEGDGEDVREWQRARAREAGAHVREWPHFERLRALVERFSVEPKHGDQYRIMPRHAAGRWFRTRSLDMELREEVVCTDTPMGEGRVLFECKIESGGRVAFISWLAPSPDGQFLALGLCSDGSERNEIRLIDVASGIELAECPTQKLMDNWTGGAQWLSDSSGFFFTGVKGPSARFSQQVYLHRRVPRPETISVAVPWTTQDEYRWIVVSRDGRYAVAMERLVNPIPVAVAPLGKTRLEWRPFIRSLSAGLPGHLIKEHYIAVTDLGASKGRLVAIPLQSPEPENPMCWRELVPESEATMTSVTVAGETLYLAEMVDTYARVRTFTTEGQFIGEVPLPDKGALGIAWWYAMHTTLPKGHREKFIFLFSSFTASSGIYAHTPGGTHLETLQEPEVRLRNVIVEDRWTESADRASIPYHIVRRSDLAPGDPQPTLLYAYGGFNYPLVPQFPGPMAAFIEAGGLYVHAHLRGGGEFGRDWAYAGRGKNKRKCYDDLYAVAEDLIGRGRCSSKTLAFSGRSLGGHLAGIALTQRPDLWGVVVPRVPLLDLIGVFRETGYTSMAVRVEFADTEDPEDMRRLVEISPYHLIREGTKYPAVFIDAGDTDPRCAPWHARKFAARLKQANAGGAPILLHVWENVGHGLATDKRTAIIEQTEYLAFTLRHLGVAGWSESQGPESLPRRRGRS